MTLLQIPDGQAAALQAKAAAEELTIEAWLGKIARATGPQRSQGRYNLADLIAQCDPTAPLSEEDKIWLQTPAM